MSDDPIVEVLIQCDDANASYLAELKAAIAGSERDLTTIAGANPAEWSDAFLYGAVAINVLVRTAIQWGQATGRLVEIDARNPKKFVRLRDKERVDGGPSIKLKAPDPLDEPTADEVIDEQLLAELLRKALGL